MADVEDSVSIDVPDRPPVSGHWQLPCEPRAMVAIAHGAGNDMNHAFIRRAQAMFCDLGASCLRFNFPYKELGRKAPDRAPVLESTWCAVVKHMRERFPNLFLIAGGKSMGGRIATMVASNDERIDALVLLGYPLHPASKPDRERADHFPRITAPILFIQGERDRLCSLDRLRAHLRQLGGPATLHVVPHGDHSFNVPKRSGLDEEAVWADISTATGSWLARELHHLAKRGHVAG